LKLQSVFKSFAVSAEFELAVVRQIKVNIDNNLIKFFTLFFKAFFVLSGC